MAAFSLMTGPSRKVRRGEVLRHQGSLSPDVYRLRQGWLVCSVVTAEGNRQITKIHLPGDLVGMPSLAANEGTETIASLTDAVIETVLLTAFSGVCREYPRFLMLLLMWSQEERARLMHQLTLIGQSRSERRMAAFLLNIYDRLLLNAPEMSLSFALPLTQADLGDAIGVSLVHANRTLRAMRNRGLIAIEDGVLTILDLQALRHLADMPSDPKRDTAWI